MIDAANPQPDGAVDTGPADAGPADAPPVDAPLVPGAIAITSPTSPTYVDSANPPAALAVEGTCSIAGATVTVRVNGATAATGTCDGTGFAVTVNAVAAPFQDGANTLLANLTSAQNVVDVDSSAITLSRLVGTIAIASPVSGGYLYAAASSSTYTVMGSCTVMGAAVTVQVNGASPSSQSASTCDGSGFTLTVDSGAAPFQDGANTIVANLAAPAMFVNVDSSTVTLTRDLSPDAITISTHASYLGSTSDRSAGMVDPSLLTNDSVTVAGTCAPQGKPLTVSIGTATSAVACSAAGTFSTQVTTTALADFTNFKLRAAIDGTAVSAAVDVFKSVAPTIHFAAIADQFALPVAGNKRSCIDCHYTKVQAATRATQAFPSSSLSFGLWDACATNGGGKPFGAAGACADISNSAAYPACDDPLASGNEACLAERAKFQFKFGYYRYSDPRTSTVAITTLNEGGYSDRVLSIVNDDVEAMIPVTNRVVRGKPNQSFLYKKVAGMSAGATISAANPADVGAANHAFRVGDTVRFSTGTLPLPLLSTSIYYVAATGFSPGGFQVATTPGGTAIDTSAGAAAVGVTATGVSSCTHAVAAPVGALTYGCKTIQGSGGSRMPLVTSGLVSSYWDATAVERLRQWILEGARTDF